MEIKETLFMCCCCCNWVHRFPLSECLDSTPLAVLFITFMAQPGSRSTGLFNCREEEAEDVAI